MTKGFGDKESLGNINSNCFGDTIEKEIRSEWVNPVFSCYRAFSDIISSVRSLFSFIFAYLTSSAVSPHNHHFLREVFSDLPDSSKFSCLTLSLHHVLTSPSEHFSQLQFFIYVCDYNIDIYLSYQTKRLSEQVLICLLLLHLSI